MILQEVIKKASYWRRVFSRTTPKKFSNKRAKKLPNDNDLIILSDVDEIPDPNKLNIF